MSVSFLQTQVSTFTHDEHWRTLNLKNIYELILVCPYPNSIQVLSNNTLIKNPLKICDFQLAYMADEVHKGQHSVFAP